MTTLWQLQQEVWTETARTLLSERRMWGSRRSGFLLGMSGEARGEQGTYSGSTPSAALTLSFRPSFALHED